MLPKGWAEKGLTGPQLAAKEAFEEAGIVGDVSSDPVGKYHYAKAMPKGRTVERAIVVFRCGWDACWRIGRNASNAAGSGSRSARLRWQWTRPSW